MALIKTYSAVPHSFLYWEMEEKKNYYPTWSTNPHYVYSKAKKISKMDYKLMEGFIFFLFSYRLIFIAFYNMYM